MKIYNAAVVGCGRIGSQFDSDPKRKFVASHAGAYAANKRIKLVAAADIDSKKLELFKSRWLVKDVYTDFRTMLKKEKIDILSVCTWPDSHFEVVKAAVKSGVKAVFCEKPITNRLSQALKMVELCRKKKIVLAINHRRRWDRLHRQIKKFISKGGLGEIQNVSCCYTGGLSNACSHLFDILRLFFGEVDWVWANFRRFRKGKDPDADGYMFFKAGFPCSIQSFDARDYVMFEIDIYGRKGRLRIEDIGRKISYWKVKDSREFSELKELVPAKLNFPENTLGEVMVNSVNDIIDCLDRRKEPFCSGEDGVRALEIISAFYKSASSGKAVKLPLKDKTIKIN